MTSKVLSSKPILLGDKNQATRSHTPKATKITEEIFSNSSDRENIKTEKTIIRNKLNPTISKLTNQPVDITIFSPSLNKSGRLLKRISNISAYPSTCESSDSTISSSRVWSLRLSRKITFPIRSMLAKWLNTIDFTAEPQAYERHQKETAPSMPVCLM